MKNPLCLSLSAVNLLAYGKQEQGQEFIHPAIFSVELRTVQVLVLAGVSAAGKGHTGLIGENI